MEVAKKLKQYVGRAAQIAENHRLQKTTFTMMAQGKVQALQESVELIKGLFDAEQQLRDKLVESTRQALAEGVEPEEVGRPLSLKEQRLKEEAEEAPEAPVEKEAPRRKGRGARA